MKINNKFVIVVYDVLGEKETSGSLDHSDLLYLGKLANKNR